MNKKNNLKKILLNNRPSHQIWGTKGGVTTMDPIATGVGIDILNKGGNAIDASIAIASTLAVTSPNWSGLAGDSTWLYYNAKKKKTTHIDGYSICPKKIDLKKFRKELKLKDNLLTNKEEPINERNTGIITSMIPGTPFLLDFVWQNFASLKFESLIQPSINLARNGFPVSEYLSKSFYNYNKKISKFKTTKKLITSNKKIKAGSTFVQKNLSETLRRFSKLRSKEFRYGETIKQILKYSKNRNPFFSSNDFKNYKIIERDVCSINYNKCKIITAGMPTSGINLLQCFELLKKFDLKKINFMSKKYVKTLISILQVVLKNRREFSSDPDFINFNQLDLIDRKYLDNIFKVFKNDNAADKVNLDDGGTTHFCVWDKNNNIVSATQSIGYQFGCGEIAGKTGLFMNDRTWWMALKDSPNSIEPGKRCNIGHAPIIIFKNNKPFLTVGSPGGFGIIQYLFQVLSHVLNFGIDLQTAIELPRFKISNNIKDIYFENRYGNLLGQLNSQNFNIKKFDEWTDIVGGVEGITKNSFGNYLNCYDVRRNSHSQGLY